MGAVIDALTLERTKPPSRTSLPAPSYDQESLEARELGSTARKKQEFHSRVFESPGRACWRIVFPYYIEANLEETSPSILSQLDFIVSSNVPTTDNDVNQALDILAD
ncbi:unnamed protein product [Lepeophtheirus salmonis]|uniref:(salmon louse) hypothetical protein n=1 Tax=Lepeophtheirus salmonis TaxID=72036 RepID=A0A7R8CQS7_LEPSM|nr:unnamed protein product [Lepeophtheirus salmonis]CAF2898089.1 unnamed protein product [Lepeophtheirus salmonis]